MSVAQPRTGPFQVIVADIGLVPEPPRVADRLGRHVLSASATDQHQQARENRQREGTCRRGHGECHTEVEIETGVVKSPVAFAACFSTRAWPGMNLRSKARWNRYEA